jgi:hypothetical protein
MPSASVMVLLTVSTPSSVGVPLIRTAPIGASLTLITAAVTSEVTVSAVPCASV